MADERYGKLVGDPYRRVVFTAEIPLDADELEAGQGSLAQAIQNVIGHTGAAVLEVEDY